MRTVRTSRPASPRAAAIAVPDTTETSCSADGPPRSTTTGGHVRSAAGWLTADPPGLAGAGSRSILRGRPGPARPVADEHDLRHELHAGRFQHRDADPVHQPADVRRGPLAVVDDEVGVLLGDGGAALLDVLQPGLVDELARRDVRARVPERAAGRGQPE